MFRMKGNTVELLRYRVEWERQEASGSVHCEEFCSSEQEKDALVARLNSEKICAVAQPVGQLPNPDERFMLGYNWHRGVVEVDGVEKEDWVEDNEEVSPWNAGNSPVGDRVLRHNQWAKTVFAVTGADYGSYELFFKYGNGFDAYIRAVKVYSTANPEQLVRWGSFSDETEIMANTFHLRPGFDYVDFVEKEGVHACHLPGNWSKAHIEVDLGTTPIPAGTTDLVVEVEYWIDDPVGVATPPIASEMPANFNITVYSIDQSKNEWFDHLCFNTMEEARQVFEAGETAYYPPVSETTRLEEEITALQLALVELYEGGKD